MIQPQLEPSAIPQKPHNQATFSTPEGDVFVHRTNLSPGRDELVEGPLVAFKVRDTPRGAEAYDVSVTRESES